MILPGETEVGTKGDATMPRDSLAGLIAPMFSSAGANVLALHTGNHKSHRTIDPHALKILAPQGRNLL
jgi:hypothetical protein